MNECIVRWAYIICLEHFKFMQKHASEIMHLQGRLSFFRTKRRNVYIHTYPKHKWGKIIHNNFSLYTQISMQIRCWISHLDIFHVDGIVWLLSCYKMVNRIILFKRLYVCSLHVPLHLALLIHFHFLPMP